MVLLNINYLLPLLGALRILLLLSFATIVPISLVVFISISRSSALPKLLRVVGLRQISEKFGSFFEDLEQFGNVRILLPFGLSLIVVFTVATAHSLLVRLLDIEVPVTYLYVVFPLVYLVAMLPVTIAGVGTREGALFFFLKPFGVSLTEVVLLSLLIYLSKLIIAALSGLLNAVESLQGLRTLNDNPDSG